MEIKFGTSRDWVTEERKIRNLGKPQVEEQLPSPSVSETPPVRCGTSRDWIHADAVMRWGFR